MKLLTSRLISSERQSYLEEAPREAQHEYDLEYDTSQGCNSSDYLPRGVVVYVIALFRARRRCHDQCGARSGSPQYYYEVQFQVGTCSLSLQYILTTVLE